MYCVGSNLAPTATPSLTLLQGGARCPHLPFGLCPRLWDAIYGSALGRRENWPSWLLVRRAPNVILDRR